MRCHNADMSIENPVFVEVTRGSRVESRHRGMAVVADSDGNIVASWGDPDASILPRSSIKPLQAIPLIETGAADALRLSEHEIAVACASHRGSPIHTETVSALLERLTLSADDLVCGAVAPNDRKAAAALSEVGETFSRLHNNCSGKHSGFLATSVHMNEAPAEYHLPDSGVQMRVRETLSEMGGSDILEADYGIDGCGVPNYAMPISALARAMARLANPEKLSAARQGTANRLYGAMAANPEIVRGGRSFDTTAIKAGGGAFVVKTGAEGVHVAMLKERGLGIAIKIEDGARRACDMAIAHLLRAFGGIDEDGEKALGYFLKRPILNTNDDDVGELRAAESWLDDLKRG